MFPRPDSKAGPNTNCESAVSPACSCLWDHTPRPPTSPSMTYVVARCSLNRIPLSASTPHSLSTASCAATQPWRMTCSHGIQCILQRSPLRVNSHASQRRDRRAEEEVSTYADVSGWSMGAGCAAVVVAVAVAGVSGGAGEPHKTY